MGCLDETSLIIQFASREISGVSVQISLFISKRMKWVAQICNLIYQYTELYQRKIFDQIIEYAMIELKYMNNTCELAAACGEIG